MLTNRLPNAIIVTVTVEDIRRGKRDSMESCPIARAVRRVVGRGARVSVSAGAIELAASEERGFYDMPRRATKFVHAFDEQAAAKPIVFTAWRYRS